MSKKTVRVNESQEARDILELCSGNLAAWSTSMFPERFSRRFSPGHRRLFAVLDDPTIRKICVIAHRKFGKTSVCHLSYPSREIMFGRSKFMVPISATATGALLQSENLKSKLLTNKNIVNFFGSMKSETFAKDLWVTANGTMVLPRGRGQQVRGILHGDYPPDTLVFDDFEDAESVMSEEQRAKQLEWVYADALASMDQSSLTSRVIFIGTLLHEDSVLANLMTDPHWTVVNIPLCDENLNPQWPEYVSREQIEKLMDEHRNKGLIDVFYREYMNKMISTEGAPFQQQFFKYYEEGTSKLNTRNDVDNIIILDPAKISKSNTSDDSAILGVGINLAANCIYVRDIDAGRYPPDEILRRMFGMAARLGARRIGIETYSLEDWIMYPISNYMRMHGLAYEIVPLPAKGKKEDRIRGLIPFYRQGLVYHNRVATFKLETQLLSFPRAKHDDVMDGLAYVVPMLEDAKQYMHYKSGNDEEDYSTIEDEYKELQYEEALDDSYMVV